MTRRAALVALALCGLAAAALAGAPDTSLRPVARAQIAAPQSPESEHPLPRRKPSGGAEQSHPARAAARQPEKLRGDEKEGGLFSSLRPLLRPLIIGREAAARERARKRGQVCGDPALQGKAVGRVPGRIAGCGVKNAVKLRSVAGVQLSQHAVMDCGQARAIKTWVERGVKPAVAGYGGGVAQLKVVAHYACRTRNNKRGAKISEHGKGRAIDIAGFLLRDGRSISLRKDWSRGKKGRILHRMHRAACGPFGTVLGPDANRYHRDHFHFDTARYRNGSYCR